MYVKSIELSAAPRRFTKEPATCGGPDLHMDEGHDHSPAILGVIELARSQPPQISRLRYYI